MEQIIIILYTKYKIFIYWFFTGAVLQYFEMQAGNVKFNLWKFIVSCCIFWILTEFAHLLILWDFVNTTLDNESRVIVLSIMIASFFYLFIPFVLKPENRGQFIESILKRFWFEKKDISKDIINKDLFK